jgi:hypothetical protein
MSCPFSTKPRMTKYLEALETLELVDDQIVVERVVPKLAGLSFCKKGYKSELATKRYHEILRNLC